MSPKKEENIQINNDVLYTNDAGNAVPPSPNNSLPNYKVTKKDLIWLFISIIAEIYTYGLDVYNLWDYWGNIPYFCYTAACTLICNCIRAYFSWKIINTKEQEESRTSPSSCVFTVVLFVFQLIPAKLDIDRFESARNSRKCRKQERAEGQRRYYRQMLKASRGIALLKMFASFLKTALRQILKVGIILRDLPGIMVGLTWPLSLILMAWSVTNYHRTVEHVLADTQNTTTCRHVWHCVTQTVIIGTRVIYIGVVGLIFPQYIILLACGLHWLVVVILLINNSARVSDFPKDISGTTFSDMVNRNKFSKLLFHSCLGICYIISYVQPVEMSTIYYHFLYHLLCVIENVIAIFLWFVYGYDILELRKPYTMAIFCVVLVSYMFTIIIVWLKPMVVNKK